MSEISVNAKPHVRLEYGAERDVSVKHMHSALGLCKHLLINSVSPAAEEIGHIH